MTNIKRQQIVRQWDRITCAVINTSNVVSVTMEILNLLLFSENFRTSLCWKYCKYKEWVYIVFFLGSSGMNRSAEQTNCPLKYKNFLYDHFIKYNHSIEHLKITPVDILSRLSGESKNDMKKRRLSAELNWIKRLQTPYPLVCSIAHREDFRSYAWSFYSLVRTFPAALYSD